MRSRLAAVVVAVLALAGRPRVADACHCDGDGPPIVVPDHVTILPPNPTLYVFAPPSDIHVEHGAEIHGARSVSRVVATSPKYIVWRHDVQLASGSFEVRVGPYYTVKYTIGDTPPNEAHIIGVEKAGDFDRWTCSTHVAFDLESTGNAIAYRFAWSDGTSTILPVWRSNYVPHGATALGLVGCDDGRWNAYGLDQQRDLVLSALFADGSEHKLGTSSAWLSRAGARVPVELVGAKLAPPAPAPAPPPTVMLETTTWWRQALAAGAGVLVVGVLAAVVARIGRRRRPHVERLAS
ncbi:MAG TPA: hypothetical protein VM513_20010 [Kofleriaceae bacterium]|jgi:hypothetical protein|nr:hypothetical protein [Kofleriaceae bacterium]